MQPEKPDMTGRPDVVLDIERLQENCNGKVEIIEELLTHLCQVSVPKWIAALEQGIKENNREKIREICHGMKGACVTIFAWRLSNLAYEFEYLARGGYIEIIARRMVELKEAASEIEGWVDANL